jgi:DNA-directed RNA polymerase subunit RPC12/RpoP
MTERTSRDEQTYYVCGQCHDKQWHLKTEAPPVPCPDCGWWHKDKEKDSVPSEIRLDLTQY